ncbi:unnamed protein product [Allacma fusca]|uniref:LSM domain-containing protein n=1 Tax=Allacma fusca TaxID=39272 RepID=A0A8J2J2S1_9HEXA|nr:unnamed protein product [Allacma fusca]
MMEQQSGGSDSSLTVDDNSSSSESNTDPESLLDGTSAKFNPLIALHCEQDALKVFRSDSPKYLHVFELEKAIPDPTKAPIKRSNLTLNQRPKRAINTVPLEAAKGKEDVKGNDPKPSSSSDVVYPMPGRKFLPHQMPVYRPPKQHPNVLTVMEDIKGPLSAIRDAMKNKRRVKVWTRNVTGIRGFCTAWVVAFDHHWNLALRDVHEIFQRKRVFESVKETEKEDYQKEREDYRSGKYLSQVSGSCGKRFGRTATVKDIKSGESTPLLVNSTDALFVFRTHHEDFTFNSRFRKPSNTTTPLPSCEDNKDITVLSASQLRKKRLTIFKEPVKDPFGFSVVARSKHFEIVERTQKQLFLVGNEIVFIETAPS